MRRALYVAASAISALLFSPVGFAETDVEADPSHHKLEFENKCVRVVRVAFGPREKAAGFFDSKDVVIVNLTTGPGLKVHFFHDGNSVDLPPTKPGQASWVPGGRIRPENPSDSRIEFLVIEPKGCN